MSKQYLTIHTVDNAHVTDIFSLAPTPSGLFSAGGSSTLHVRSTTSPTFPITQSVAAAHRLGIHHVCTARGGPGRVAVTAGFGGEIKIWTCKEPSDDWQIWHEIRPGARAQPTTNSSSGVNTNGNAGANGPVPASAAGDAPGDAWAVALSADENYLAVTTHDGKIHVWDLVARQRIQTYETGSGSAGGSFGLAVDLSRDGRLTASGHQNGGVYVFNNDTGRMVYSLSGLARPVRAVAFSPGCKRLAAAGDAGIIALYDVEHGEHVSNLSPSGGGGGAGSGGNAWITSIDWNDTGEYLLSGSLDGKVRVWDVGRGVCVATHSETDKALWSVRWLPKTERAPTAEMGRGEMFCTAGANRSIAFYREATGT